MQRERAVGWAAVLAQFAAIGALLLATRSSTGGPQWLWWVGLLLVVAGVLVLVLSFLHLGAALTPNPVPNGAGLRQHGVYSRIRHPIYTGVLMIMLGVVCRSPGWWPLFWWVVLVAVLTAKAVWEERMLTERFPEYATYRQRTGRFLPNLHAARGA